MATPSSGPVGKRSVNAAEQLREPFANRQAKTRAAETPRCRLVGLRKGLKDPFLLLMGHADAGIDHVESEHGWGAVVRRRVVIE